MTAAVLAICSYPCATIEEAHRKAAYVATIPSIDDFSDGNVLAFIRSFMSQEAERQRRPNNFANRL